jgi:hypothetical protein
MIKRIYLLVLCSVFMSGCSDRDLGILVKAPKVRSSNSTLIFEPALHGGSIQIQSDIFSGSILSNSIISNAISLFNEKIKSPWVLFVSVEGASIATDLCLSPNSGPLLEFVSKVLIQEAKSVSPFLLAGASSGVATSLDGNIFRDRNISMYRLAKDGVVITICLIYPFVFDPSLTLSSVLSSIALKRMSDLYSDVKSSLSSNNNSTQEVESNSSTVNNKKGWIAGIAVSATGVIASNCFVRYCADTWLQIKQLSTFEVAYNTAYNRVSELVSNIFSFHNLH